MLKRSPRLGVVYVSLNKVITHYAVTKMNIEHVCKIGMSWVGAVEIHRRNTVDQNPFCKNEYVYLLPTSMADRIEKYVHKLLNSCRIKEGAGTEWFRCSAEEAVNAVKFADKVFLHLTRKFKHEDSCDWVPAQKMLYDKLVEFKMRRWAEAAQKNRRFAISRADKSHDSAGSNAQKTLVTNKNMSQSTSLVRSDKILTPKGIAVVSEDKCESLCISGEMSEDRARLKPMGFPNIRFGGDVF